MAASKAIKLTFELERETKNTYRFAEVADEDVTPVVGTLYVQKSAFPDGKPETVDVTLAAK